MSTIGYLHLLLLGMLGLAGLTPAVGAQPSLGEAVRAADAEYLETPESGTIDESPKIVAGGGEDGLPPLDEEVSQGRLRVTLTYVEEEPQAESRSLAEDLPGEADDVPLPAEEEPAAADEIPLEDIPEDAMLPGEFDLGEEVWRAPVVTVYFDDPNPKPVEVAPEEIADATDTDMDQPESNADQADAGGGQAEADAGQAEGDAAPALAEDEAPETETATPPGPIGPRVVAKLQGPGIGVSNPPVSVQIAELDPNNGYPEVVVSFFTGGAHCCSVTHVVTSNEDGTEWTTLDVGEFDGGPMLPVDLDGDETFEFETRDNAFLYAFACYACSQAPLQVLALREGQIKDVSADPRFKPAHAAWLKAMIVGVPEQEVNGFLAGYVAQKTRLGEGKEAWDLMLKYYDRNTDWGLEVCDTERDETGDCPGETTTVTFPQALERMLNKNGYKIGG